MFKDVLRKTRENAGLSQKQVADLLEIPDTTYRNYENTTREPDFVTLSKIADVFKVSIDYLLERTQISNFNDNVILKQTQNLLSIVNDLDEKSIEYLTQDAGLLKIKQKVDKNNDVKISGSLTENA